MSALDLWLNPHLCRGYMLQHGHPQHVAFWHNIHAGTWTLYSPRYCCACKISFKESHLATPIDYLLDEQKNLTLNLAFLHKTWKSRRTLALSTKNSVLKPSNRARGDRMGAKNKLCVLVTCFSSIICEQLTYFVCLSKYRTACHWGLLQIQES